MTSSYTIDTFAWVEYLRGSRPGRAARPFIEGGRAFTPTIVLSELRKWYLRELEADRRSLQEMERHFRFVQTRTTVVPLDARLAIDAGETDLQMKKRVGDWPLADSIILATARSSGSLVVTGDPHFRGLKEALLID